MGELRCRLEVDAIGRTCKGLEEGGARRRVEPEMRVWTCC